MALPKLQTPEYKLLLPSTQEEIKYRPFLVKEQKILMIAQESGEEKQLADAMGELVSNCTFGVLINPQCLILNMYFYNCDQNQLVLK